MEINSARKSAALLACYINLSTDATGFIDPRLDIKPSDVVMEVTMDLRSFSKWLNCMTMPELF